MTLEGRKVLLGLALGSRESYQSWLAFGRDLIERGMNQPALVIADAAPGLWKAVRELWPSADEQRYTVHALRNVTAKLPERHHREIKASWWKAFDDAASPAQARCGLEAIVADYRTAYPSAMAVIERDLDAQPWHHASQERNGERSSRRRHDGPSKQPVGCSDGLRRRAEAPSPST